MGVLFWQPGIYSVQDDLLVTVHRSQPVICQSDESSLSLALFTGIVLQFVQAFGLHGLCLFGKALVKTGQTRF